MLLTPWAYAMPFKSSEERNCWLPLPQAPGCEIGRGAIFPESGGHFGRCIGRRCDMALGGLSPKQRQQVMLAE